MSFAQDVIAAPISLINPIVQNNTAGVAENLTEVPYQLTRSGYMNTLHSMWNAGKQERVMEILSNVPYIDSNGPNYLAEYMAEKAKPNETVIMTYKRYKASLDVEENLSEAIGGDTHRNLTIGAAIIVLLVIFIYYVK